MTQLPNTETEQLFDWLKDCAAANKPAPPNRDICERFGFQSGSTAAKLVQNLENAGLISVERSRAARVITIVETGQRTAETRPAKAIMDAVKKKNWPPSIIVRRDRQCQWIDGKPTADDSCKCRRSVVPGTAWCPDHLDRVYRPPEAGTPTHLRI